MTGGGVVLNDFIHKGRFILKVGSTINCQVWVLDYVRMERYVNTRHECNNVSVLSTVDVMF